MATKTPKMTARDQRFVDEYLKCFDPPTAALAAGFSASMAKTKAYLWVSSGKTNPKPFVFEAIQASMAARAKKMNLTQDRVLEEIARIGFFDAKNLFTETGNLLSPADMEEDTTRAIAGIDVVERKVPSGKTDARGRAIMETEYIKKIRMVDKLGALKILAAHVGIATDRQEHTGAGGAPLVAPQIIFKAVMGKGKPAEATTE